MQQRSLLSATAIDSLYFVPSHRAVPPENLAGFLSEVEFGQRIAKRPLPFVFLDDLDQRDNEDGLAVAAAEFPGTTVFHFGREHVNQLIARLTDEFPASERPTLQQLVLKPEVNFGNTINTGTVGPTASFPARSTSTVTSR